MSDYDEGEDRFVSIGERLRRAREARAMSLDDVATQTRIPMRHLQHIEQEDWDALPAPTYAIGFTRNYASAVGLDGPAIANELRDQIGGPRRRTPTPEFYEPADPARVPPKSLAIIVIVIAALLIGAYALWRNTLGADPGATPEQNAEATAVPGEVPADNGQAAAPQDATGQTVTLTAVENVWVQVTDGAARPALISRQLNAGETYSVPPGVARPLLMTGRPQVLRVTVGGRDLGLIAPTERRVRDVSLLPQDLAARASAQPAVGPASSPAPATALAPTANRRPSPAPTPAQDSPPAGQPDAPLSQPLPPPQ